MLMPDACNIVLGIINGRELFIPRQKEDKNSISGTAIYISLNLYGQTTIVPRR